MAQNLTGASYVLQSLLNFHHIFLAFFLIANPTVLKNYFCLGITPGSALGIIWDARNRTGSVLGLPYTSQTPCRYANTLPPEFKSLIPGWVPDDKGKASHCVVAGNDQQMAPKHFIDLVFRGYCILLSFVTVFYFDGLCS